MLSASCFALAGSLPPASCHKAPLLLAVRLPPASLPCLWVPRVHSPRLSKIGLLVLHLRGTACDGQSNRLHRRQIRCGSGEVVVQAQGHRLNRLVTADGFAKEGPAGAASRYHRLLTA